MQDIDRYGIWRDFLQRESELHKLLVTLAHTDDPSAADFKTKAFGCTKSLQLILDSMRSAKLREKRWRGFEIAVNPLKPRRLELYEIGLRQQSERRAESYAGDLAHFIERLTNVINILVREIPPRSHDTNSIRAVRFGILRGLDARFGTDPSVVLTAGFPVR